jgi:hypothetical protein
MSEGSWLPKTWGEAVPQVFWGVLILGFGLELCISILDANYGRALAALVGLLTVLAMLIHQDDIRQRLLKINPNWIAASFTLFLAALILFPFVEEKLWPLSAWFQSSAPSGVVHDPPKAEDIAKATSAIQDKLDEALTQRDQSLSENTSLRNQLATMKRDLEASRATVSQPPLDSAPLVSQTHEVSWEFALMSNEVLKRHAYELAQEIEDLWRGFDRKRSEALYGNDSYYLTSGAKADKALLIENDASEKFKETIVSRYNSLQSELIKRTKSIKPPNQFG